MTKEQFYKRFTLALGTTLQEREINYKSLSLALGTSLQEREIFISVYH